MCVCAFIWTKVEYYTWCFRACLFYWTYCQHLSWQYTQIFLILFNGWMICLHNFQMSHQIFKLVKNLFIVTWPRTHLCITCKKCFWYLIYTEFFRKATACTLIENFIWFCSEPYKELFKLVAFLSHQYSTSEIFIVVAGCSDSAAYVCKHLTTWVAVF